METLIGSRLFWLALLACVLPLLGALGSRWQLWPYSLGLLLLLAGLLLALPVLGLALWQRQWFALLLACLPLLVLLPPLIQGLRLPVINDISTDLVSPPVLNAAARLRGPRHHAPNYPGPATAEKQRAGWPTLGPLTLPLSPREVKPLVLDLVRERGWQRVDDQGADNMQIEAVVSSRWFGFEDDVAIRLTAQDGGTRVDMRSASRVGKSDFGANAGRVQDFLADLDHKFKE
ncbi:DUF1499 domain-containing protein [Zobellella maritima]|uniref:DUF1499 domain-containing protein n=1 Tax=Zobellella maritima TaxID=2059725 RepID=UPI000E2FFD72|nr:DUF1499 domain-containing protein [Zobellella maritima]